MRFTLSKLQRFSTGDGPGIRTTVFFAGCNLRCLWCHNPETWGTTPVTLRFKEGKDVLSCREADTEEVFSEIKKDEAFYRRSKGGVTLSGGEPLLQADAAADLLMRCKKEGISTLVDTAGAVPYAAFQKVLPFADLFYYDIKAADEKKYRTFVGCDFSLVKENLLRLTADGAKVVVRIPTVFGVNTDAATTNAVIDLCKRAKIEEIDLLPYHKYGVSKYEALGMEYPLKDKRSVPKALVHRLAERYRAAGFTVKIEK